MLRHSECSSFPHSKGDLEGVLLERLVLTLKSELEDVLVRLSRFIVEPSFPGLMSNRLVLWVHLFLFWLHSCLSLSLPCLGEEHNKCLNFISANLREDNN